MGALLAQPSDVLAAIALGNTLSNALLVALTVGGGLALDPGIPGLGWVAAGLLLPTFGIGLDPALAAAAMGGSSVTVVLNALRLRRLPLERDRLN